MPKRSKDNRPRVRMPWGAFPRFAFTGRSKSVSRLRREALYEYSGQPYDRDPCPHVLRTRELAVAESFPIRPGDVITYDAPCVRPSAHMRETRLIPVDKSGATVAVPDDAARLHADAAGRTWA